MEKVLLWTDEKREDNGMVIDPKEVEERVPLHGDTVYLFPRLDEESAKILGETLTETEDIEETLKSKHIAYELADDSETLKDIWAFSCGVKEIFNLLDCEVQKVYKYWDGSNWKEIWFDDAVMTEYEIIINNEKTKNLDTWDGSNWSFRSKFNHGLLYPIVKIDGEEADNEFLLEQWTQYQGDIPVGEIITAEQAEELKSK